VGRPWALSTPNRALKADVSIGYVSGPIFAEASEGRALNVFLNLEWKPTSTLRVASQWPHQRITRAQGGRWFSTANIPRVKIEYQLTRDIFFRYIGQYFAQVRDTLRDPRSGNLLVISGTPQGRVTQTEFATTSCSPISRLRVQCSSLATARHSVSPIRSASAACRVPATDSS